MKFKKIYIEITNVCNMTCSFCPKSNRKPSFMSLESFEDILKKIHSYTNFIYLHVKGEPFLHSEIIDFIKLAEKYNLKVNITTNGTILTKEVLTLPNLRQINFSLHSFEEHNLEKKSKYLKEILDFSILAQENEIIVSLRLWNLGNLKGKSENLDTLKTLSNFFHTELIQENFIRGKGIKLSNKIYLNFEEVFEWPKLESTYYNEVGTCQGLNTHIGILVDGTVVPCCLDDEGVIALGNIHEVSDLAEITKSEKPQNMINGFKKRLCTEELCKHCQFKERF